MELFNKRPPAIFDMAVIEHMPPECGPVSSNAGKFEFHNGNRPSDDVIELARQKAIEKFNREDVKVEAEHRILRVTKDLQTQVNMMMWVITEIDNGWNSEDHNMARAVMRWISLIQSTARNLVYEPTYREDRHWPSPPLGAREFMNRF